MELRGKIYISIIVLGIAIFSLVVIICSKDIKITFSKFFGDLFQRKNLNSKYYKEQYSEVLQPVLYNNSPLKIEELRIPEYKNFVKTEYQVDVKDHIPLKNNNIITIKRGIGIDISFGYGHKNTCCFPNRLDLFKKNYKPCEILGDARFVAVLKIKTLCCDSIYVIKKSPLVNETKVYTSGFVDPELYFAKYFQLYNLPHIVKPYHAYYYNGEICIISEYLERGSLKNVSFMGEFYDEKIVYNCVKSLFLAIAILHKNKIIHMDIKPENLCIDKNYILKVIDFGLSYKADAGYKSMLSNGGTVAFIAPEYLSFDKLKTYQADWWSFGVTLYILIENYTPYMHKLRGSPTERCKSLKKNIKEGGFRNFTNKKVNPLLKDLITRLLEPNEDKRLGCGINAIEDIMRHPYFKRENLGKILRKYEDCENREN
ncbi:Ribosomal protein S6 kinase [Spraguea lophii 42_110]|uniref:Ribosomal protein S6 kinase n=1 Tax=Spraguea lophii (strain 42_110) TaxID=1358809 RepID=S7WAF3_SPRLO|nr:Ribosomal protein S6 kinase [Spraguea lophii 42_110]